MVSKSVEIKVNGRSKRIDIDTRARLVDLLRDQLQLTGTHIGCGTGNCGACTVFLDGRTVKSCCVLAAEADRCSVLTIEGLAGEESLHPVQESFVENHGLQCGFCTPGMILSAIQLIEDNPNPSDDDIREAIAGNICRCTGYVKVVESIRHAASRLRAAELR